MRNVLFHKPRRRCPTWRTPRTAARAYHRRPARTPRTFLLKAAKMPNKPEGFQELERRIRDVVYEAEDTIDSCISQAASASHRKPLRRELSGQTASASPKKSSPLERERSSTWWKRFKALRLLQWPTFPNHIRLPKLR